MLAIAPPPLALGLPPYPRITTPPPLSKPTPIAAQPISARDMFGAHNMCYNLYLMGIIMFTPRTRTNANVNVRARALAFKSRPEKHHPEMQSFLKVGSFRFIMQTCVV